MSTPHTWVRCLLALALAPFIVLSLDGAATSAKPKAPTVRFTEGRDYVVTTKVAGRRVRGQGTMPTGLVKARVKARPLAQRLGGTGREAVVDYGVSRDGLAHVYTIFTHRKKKLRPVTLNGYQVVLPTYLEGGDEAGFYCAGGLLHAWWFSVDRGSGQRTAYKLKKTRLARHKTVAIAERPAKGPRTCW